MTLDCYVNNLTHVRCCLSSQFHDILNNEIIGKDCEELENEKKKFRVHQMYLDKLMCIDTDKLEMECLTEEEITNLLEELLSVCKPC